jgi:hypothetical protein
LQSRRARSPMMSSAIMTADWAARFGDRWTVPVGKGVGRFSRSVRSSSTRACSSGMTLSHHLDTRLGPCRCSSSFSSPRRDEPPVAEH